MRSPKAPTSTSSANWRSYDTETRRLALSTNSAQQQCYNLGTIESNRWKLFKRAPVMPNSGLRMRYKLTGAKTSGTKLPSLRSNRSTVPTEAAASVTTQTDNADYIRCPHSKLYLKQICTSSSPSSQPSIGLATVQPLGLHSDRHLPAAAKSRASRTNTTTLQLKNKSSASPQYIFIILER